MIVAVKECCISAPESSIYFLDTEKLAQKLPDLARQFETQDIIECSYDLKEQNDHWDFAVVHPPIMVAKTIDLWV